MFRIIQEALTNVTRHAQATHVEIGLQTVGNEWVLDIRDNGRGFAPESVTGSQAVGVLGMRERAGMFGGAVDLLSKPDQGTTVRVRMPEA